MLVLQTNSETQFSTTLSHGKHSIKLPFEKMPAVLLYTLEGSTGGCGQAHEGNQVSFHVHHSHVEVAAHIHDDTATLTVTYA